MSEHAQACTVALASLQVRAEPHLKAGLLKPKHPTAETLHQALQQGDTQPLPAAHAAQHWWGWTRPACSALASHKGHACPPLEARLCSTVNISWVSSSVIWIFHSLTLRCRPTQILGVRQPAMTVVEQLSGFLLSSDTGRSSILLYYYTTFPCVCQLFLSYRELYSFQTSVMNLQKRSNFFFFKAF